MVCESLTAAVISCCVLLLVWSQAGWTQGSGVRARWRPDLWTNDAFSHGGYGPAQGKMILHRIGFLIVWDEEFESTDELEQRH